MGINDAVDWRTDLGGGTTVALIQAGTFRTDAGAIFGPVPRLLWDKLVTDEIDHDHRLLQALNCLLIETPSGRVLVETGIGDRLDDKTRTMRGYEGPVDRAGARDGRLPARVDQRRGHEPPPLRPCRRAAPGRWRAGLPARHDRRPEGRVGGRPRRQPAARGVVRPAGAAARRATGAREGWADGERRAPAGRVGHPDRRPLGRPPGHRRARHRRRRPHRSCSSATCSCVRGAPTRAG